MGLKLKVELGADGTGFVTVMDKAEKQVQKFGSGLSALKGYIAAAFSIGAIEQMVKGTIQLASHLRDVSDELGVNVEWLQEMQYVAKQNGADIDILDKTLRKLTESRSAALGSGGGKQAAAFQKFGINPEEIQTGKLTGIVDKIAEAFRTGSQQELEPAFREIGGKGAAILIPSFLDGLAAGRAAAREAGAVMSDDVIDQLDELDDKMQTLGLQLKSGLAPIILTVIDAFRGLIGMMKTAAAYIVGFFETLDFKALFKKAMAGDFAGGGGEIVHANEMAVKNAEAEYQDQVDAEKERMKAAKVRKAARARRENGDISITPLEPGKEKFQFAKNSDALTGIGNFLGGSGVGSDLVSIGEKTNQLLTTAVSHLNTIASKPSWLPAEYDGVPRT